MWNTYGQRAKIPYSDLWFRNAEARTPLPTFSFDSSGMHFLTDFQIKIWEGFPLGSQIICYSWDTLISGVTNYIVCFLGERYANSCCTKHLLCFHIPTLDRFNKASSHGKEQVLRIIHDFWKTNLPLWKGPDIIKY